MNGNHRHTALKQLGFESAICYNLGKITETQAKRIAIETNETRFRADNKRMATVIQEILAEFSLEELSGTTAFSEQDLKNIMDMNGFDFDAFENKSKTEPKVKEPNYQICPHCGESVLIP